MPTLYLPAAHTDTDVALATEVANVVGSRDLYVAWTHGEGPGLAPAIETRTADALRANPISPFAEVVVAMVAGIAALWHALVHPPSARGRSSPRRATIGSCRAPRPPKTTSPSCGGGDLSPLYADT